MSSKQTYFVDGNKTPRLIDKFFVIGGDGKPRQVQTLYLCNSQGVPQPIYKSSMLLKNLSNYASKFIEFTNALWDQTFGPDNIATYTLTLGRTYFIRAGCAMYRPESASYYATMKIGGHVLHSSSARIDSDLSQTFPSGAMFNALYTPSGSGTAKKTVQLEAYGKCSDGASSGGVGRFYMLVDVTELIESEPGLTADAIWERIGKSVFYGEKEFEL